MIDSNVYQNLLMSLLIGCFFVFFICVCCIGACTDVGCSCCREECGAVEPVEAQQKKQKTQRKRRKLKLYSVTDPFGHRCKHQHNSGLQLDVNCNQKKTAETKNILPPVVITTMASIETETTEFSSDSTPPPGVTNKEFSSRNFYDN